jgi:hypothetical protein
VTGGDARTLAPGRTVDRVTTPLPRAGTLGELRAAGWVSRTVKDEIRANLLEHLRAGGSAFPGIVGFDDTVPAELNGRCSPATTSCCSGAWPGQDAA